jgi:hypothetical protein
MSPREYADMIISDTHIGGGQSRLGAQPSTIEGIAPYIKDVLQPGVHPDSITAGLFVDGTCCMYYHIGPWRDLMLLYYQKVFHGTSPEFPLLALQYDEQILNGGLELGYCWRKFQVRT